MVTGIQIARAGPIHLGTPYSEMDCQTFVERCLSDCGIRKDLKGSNAWYRYLMKNGWTGSPSECVRKFGSIPVGAFLIVHKFDGGEEARGYHDGLGNASHIGIYTNMSGQEMCALALSAGNEKAGNYIFGDGAIASSSTRKHVATSTFNGKAISGGWNKIGLWTEISYGEHIDKILRGGAEPDPEPDPEPEPEKATVDAEKGCTVKMRANPTTSCRLYWDVPIGSTVAVLEQDAAKDGSGSMWSRISWAGQDGWMQSRFLRFAETGEYTVIISGLTEEQADAIVRRYPEAIKTAG